MDTVVNALMQTLRDHRLRASPAESIDTLNALQNTGSRERETVKASLLFSASEQRETGAAVRRVARRIQGARTRRLKEDRSGRINVPHTLRHNVRYEDAPFDPVLRKRCEGKLHVALLCYIGLSTRNLARFWLRMIYQMQSLFSEVRRSVFAADVAKVVSEVLLKARA